MWSWDRVSHREESRGVGNLTSLYPCMKSLKNKLIVLKEKNGSYIYMQQYG